MQLSTKVTILSTLDSLPIPPDDAGKREAVNSGCISMFHGRRILEVSAD
jgi:hypothetical protein